MSDGLIKKSDAIEVAKAFWYKPDIAGALAELPAIEPKRGEWIDKGWKGDWQFETDGRGNCWHEYECSECGFHKKGGKSNFCPNCGADMRERKESDR